MVVNSIVAAMVHHVSRRCGGIYQIGSSLKNPVRYANLQDYAFHYFTEKPWINKEGKPVKVGKVTMLSSMASFHRYMAVRYTFWLKVCHHQLGPESRHPNLHGLIPRELSSASI